MFTFFITGASNTRFPKLTKISITKDSSYIQNNDNKDQSEEIKQVFIDDSVLFYSEGLATYYGKRFQGRKTASGEKFDRYDFSAAHKKLPFGTIVRVRNTQNNKSIFVRINDRGPFSKKRIIDLSTTAAKVLEIDGVANVEIDGFKKNFQTENNEEDFYYGYSYNNDLITINKDQFTIISKTDDFGYAVELYNNLTEKDDVYLFVKPNIAFNNKINSDQFYYIGKLKCKIGNGRTYNLSQFN